MDFKLRKQTIEFKDTDGNLVGKIIVRQAALVHEQTLYDLRFEAKFRTTEHMKKIGARELTPGEIKRIFFNEDIYPRLAACSEGDLPTEDEAFSMPSDYSIAWYNAAMFCNPEWFELFTKVGNLADLTLKQQIDKLSPEDKKKEEPKQTELISS